MFSSIVISYLFCFCQLKSPTTALTGFPPRPWKIISCKVFIRLVPFLSQTIAALLKYSILYWHLCHCHNFLPPYHVNIYIDLTFVFLHILLVYPEADNIVYTRCLLTRLKAACFDKIGSLFGNQHSSLAAVCWYFGL